MTLAAVYTEICNRAGLGYANFADRAQAAFWKAVGNIVRSGDYTDQELRTAANRIENEAYLSNEFPYDISGQTAITTDYVLDMQIDLRPGYPENIHFTRMDEQVMHRATYLRPLAAGGLKEVFYTLKYPLVEINYDTTDSVLAAAWAYVAITWRGVSRAIAEGTTLNTTEASTLFSQGFTNRAIEAAVALMAQET